MCRNVFFNIVNQYPKLYSQMYMHYILPDFMRVSLGGNVIKTEKSQQQTISDRGLKFSAKPWMPCTGHHIPVMKRKNALTQ